MRLSFLIGLGVTVAAGALVLALQEDPERERAPWRIERPRVPKPIRRRFARVSLTAATVWATVALILSIVPSYAADLRGTQNVALLAAISAIALVSSCITQIVSERRRPSVQLSQAVGLRVLAAGLLALVAAAPLHSLAVLVAGSVAAGAGHGVAFLNAQEELNDIAPPEHRGDVTAAFIACIYFLVASTVISTGLLDLRFSLSLSVSVVALALTGSALAGAAWQSRNR